MIVNILIAIFSAMIAVAWIHPRLVAIAIKKTLVDSSDERKLQRVPVPVLGGVAVFFGIVLGITLTSSLIDCMSLMSIVAAMMIMLYAGTLDDMINLPALQRLAVEIGVVVLLIFSTHQSINDFHGLWDTYWFGPTIAVPLTIFATVGIINAINLVDGVDGLSSGYCIMASMMFGVFYYYCDYYLMLLLCLLSIGSLLPFFFHNVFGKRSKMFIGDGGSLMMGVIMSTYVVMAVSSGGESEVFVDAGLGVVPFTLAVMSVPVFDTMRVMIMRIIRKTSPFHPDKTHLHHLFIELGFSHFGTTLSELFLNVVVIAAWYATYKFGASIDVQFYVVMGVGLLLTAGFYKFVKINQVHNTALLRLLQRIGAKTHFENNNGWLKLQKIVDFK
jgi:UDP-N-acetylmuramyl pentapeptide phosphotransferase/UDP-N-acetylglucosamine-1-phosphate transferase